MALRRCMLPLLRSQTEALNIQVIQPLRLCSSKTEKSQQDQLVPTQPQEAASDDAKTAPEPATTTATATRPSMQEEWTEVIDEKSGQPYFWNQKTGGHNCPTGRHKCGHQCLLQLDAKHACANTTFALSITDRVQSCMPAGSCIGCQLCATCWIACR